MKVCKTCGTKQEKGLICDKGHVLYTDPPDDIILGRVLEGRYEVRSILGGGGFGMVYMAAQTKLNNRPCVIKVARPELANDEQFVARFDREKKALMSLRSRNTVQIIDYGRTDDKIDYIVMEYIEGEELSVIIRRAGRFTQDRAIHIAHGICGSLEEAHAVGILHRDLKPANVMIVNVGSSEMVKVIDFGIARLADSAEGDFKTATGQMPGTPAYSPYEQLIGQTKLIDERTDIYSLGAIFYEMLTGHPPYGDTIKSTSFDSSTLYFLALARAKAEQTPTAPSQILPPGAIDPLMDQLILTMLEAAVAKRPSSAQEVLRVLERVTRRAAGEEELLDADTTVQGHSAAAAAAGLDDLDTEAGLPSPAASLARTGIGDAEVKGYSPTQEGAAPAQTQGPATTSPRPVETQSFTKQGQPAGTGMKWAMLFAVVVLIMALGLIGILALTGTFSGKGSKDDESALAQQLSEERRRQDDREAAARQTEKERLEDQKAKAQRAAKEAQEAKAALQASKEAEAQRKLDEARSEAEAARKALAELSADGQAEKKAEEEARLKAEEEARLKAEEEARLEEQRRKGKAARYLERKNEKKAAEEEARKRAAEEAKKKAEEEAKKKAAEEAKSKAAAEAKKKKAAEEAKKKAEEEAKKKAEEEAKKKALHKKLNFMDDDDEE